MWSSGEIHRSEQEFVASRKKEILILYWKQKMNKRHMFVLLMGLAAFSALVAIGQAAIELDYFPPGQNITLNKNFAIFYMWEPGNLAVPPTHFKLELYRGEANPANLVGLIAQDIALGKPGVNQTGGGSPDNGGIYTWKAGALIAGQAPAGNGYCVRAVTMDGQITSYCYGFNLVEPPSPNLGIVNGNGFILVQRDPVCPMCGVFDIRALLDQVSFPAGSAGNLVLLRNGRRIGLLGKLGAGALPPGQKVKLQFTTADFALVQRGGQGFELAIIGDTGKILRSKQIVLKMEQ
jgi:hypothetical protein